MASSIIKKKGGKYIKMAHKFNITDWTEKKQAKQDLDQPHTPPNSIPALRERVNKIERILNVVPNSE